MVTSGSFIQRPFNPRDLISGPGFNPFQQGGGFSQTPFPIGQGQTTGPGSFPSGFGQSQNEGGNNPFGSDFISDLFEEEPQLAFQGALANRSQNFSPIQQQFFPSQFQSFFNRFLGQSAQSLQGGTSLGNLPTFQDFLGGVNFQDEFRSLPPSLRPGSNTARFRPPTQFQF